MKPRLRAERVLCPNIEKQCNNGSMRERITERKANENYQIENEMEKKPADH